MQCDATLCTSTAISVLNACTALCLRLYQDYSGAMTPPNMSLVQAPLPTYALRLTTLLQRYGPDPAYASTRWEQYKTYLRTPLVRISATSIHLKQTQGRNQTRV
eukprot:2678042-Rhodomonas_salina.1